MRGIQRAGAIGFVLTAIATVVITLSPHRVDANYETEIYRFLDVLHRHGVPEWFGYRKLEFTANIALVVPLGFFLGLTLPAGRRWIGYLALPLLSATIELIQKVALSDRVASLADVLANSLGAWFGLTVAMGIHAVRARNRRRSAQDEPARRCATTEGPRS